MTKALLIFPLKRLSYQEIGSDLNPTVVEPKDCGYGRLVGKRFQHWHARSKRTPNTLSDLGPLLLSNRAFERLDTLNYGDHGLEAAVACLTEALTHNRRIALYADYDVDGTMSCVSWVWFLRAIGFENFVTYIPCRFKEGYGVNLTAVKHLIDNEKVDVIITMDTGITANEEARYCKERGVQFLCTDHHKIQPEKMPDCITLNPKLHPEPAYQELCGCGITFVLLRRLAEKFPVPNSLWTDLLALAGMATICDVVPLNRVNHRLAGLGVNALMRSERPVLKRLREAASLQEGLDEKDVGFRLGPRINAVGRLGHADQVVEAFLSENPEPLIAYMGECNERRKQIQKKIVAEAKCLADAHSADPVLFLGGDWHPGVVGIAASRIAETYWRPTWLFERQNEIGKGSARSVPGFDVTEAMQSCGELFLKFGGHRAAGGYAFPLKNESAIRQALTEYAQKIQSQSPELWESSTEYDCDLPLGLLTPPLTDEIDGLRPYGNSFEEPRFRVQGKILSVQFYRDKQTGEPKHTALMIGETGRPSRKILFFNEVLQEFQSASAAAFLVTARRDTFRGETTLTLMGHDFSIDHD